MAGSDGTNTYQVMDAYGVTGMCCKVVSGACVDWGAFESSMLCVHQGDCQAIVQSPGFQASGLTAPTFQTVLVMPPPPSSPPAPPRLPSPPWAPPQPYQPVQPPASSPTATPSAGAPPSAPSTPFATLHVNGDAAQLILGPTQGCRLEFTPGASPSSVPSLTSSCPINQPAAARRLLEEKGLGAAVDERALAALEELVRLERDHGKIRRHQASLKQYELGVARLERMLRLTKDKSKLAALEVALLDLLEMGVPKPVVDNN